MKKRIFSLMLAVMMLAALLSGVTLAAGEVTADYTLILQDGKVYKYPVKDENIITFPGIEWDGTNNQWVFNNLDFKTTANNAVAILDKVDEPIKLKLIGENKIETTGIGTNGYAYAFQSYALHVTGDGSLTATASSQVVSNIGIGIGGSLTNDATLIGIAGDCTGSSDICTYGVRIAGSLTNNGTLTVTAGSAIQKGEYAAYGNSTGLKVDKHVINTGTITATSGSANGNSHAIYTDRGKGRIITTGTLTLFGNTAATNVAPDTSGMTAPTFTAGADAASAEVVTDLTDLAGYKYLKIADVLPTYTVTLYKTGLTGAGVKNAVIRYNNTEDATSLTGVQSGQRIKIEIALKQGWAFHETPQINIAPSAAIQGGDFDPNNIYTWWIASISADTEITVTGDVRELRTIQVISSGKGTVTGGGTYTDGSSVVVKAEPDNGYHFVKWMENGVEYANMPTHTFTVSRDLTLTAEFALNTYTVTFDPGNGTVDPATATVLHDGTLAILPTPTRTGYTFHGWYDEPVGGSEVTTATVFTQDTIIYASWNECRHENSTALPTCTASAICSLCGETLNALGHDFTGHWVNTDPEGHYRTCTRCPETDLANRAAHVYDDILDTSCNICGYVRANATFPVTLHANGGTLAGNLTSYTYGTGAALPAASRDRYTFDGWYATPDFTGAPVTAIGPKEFGAKTFWAKWTYIPSFITPTPMPEPSAPTIPPIAAILPFTDVPASAWYYDDVLYVYQHGLMNGTGSGKFSPDLPLNRAMLVTTLYRLAGEPAVSAANAFSDLPEGQWYTAPMKWAVATGIIRGYGDGTCRPLDPITREEALAVLRRYAGANASGDAAGYTCSDWAVADVAWAVKAGLLGGLDMADLTRDADRAEIAALLRRFAGSIR